MKNQLENKYIRLTPCERIVMETVWATSQNMSLMEILDIVEKKYHKNWKRQTVATFLTHIIEKGLLSSYRIGRIFYYTKVVAKSDYIAQEAPEILRDLYSDNVMDFLNAINKSRGFTEDEKRDILYMLDNS